MQEESEKYAGFKFQNELQWDSLSNRIGQSANQQNNNISKSCNLNKIVFGWHPYWVGTTYYNYDWSLLTDLSYFDYDVDPATGNASSTNGWATAKVVDSAQAHGVRVNLAVCLFASHATFLQNPTAVQTLITNLITLVQSRNADGVNIDFEGVPSAQKANFTSFMISLCNQFHSQIPGSQISVDLPSVEWSDTYDVVAMEPSVDLFIIMGYDYYYSGSAQAGPTDPLYNLTTGYNYCHTKSVNYYLNKGVPNNKLILGLPYYGREWPTVSNTVPSNVSATGVSRTYKYVRDNASGNYSNKLWNNTSFTPYYAFQTGAQWNQCFADDGFSMGKRFELVNQRNIGGIGIWALGYDDGYVELWNQIKDKFTNCGTIPCSDTIYDMGGPDRNYYDRENYSYTISPSGASSLSLTFQSFSTEPGYDTLWIYNGTSTASPLIGAYTGTNSPGTVNATGNALTLKYKSDNATNAAGWKAYWNCYIDNISPTTSISTNNLWKTQDFLATFADADNIGGSGIEKAYYTVSDFNGFDWEANTNNGFLTDNFDTLKASLWTNPLGSNTWSVSNGELFQADSTIGNSNIFAPLNQNLSNRYLYHFTFKALPGNYLTNQHRFGFHFFCDSAQYSNRRNSYFIYFRIETSKLEFYKVTNDVFTLVSTINNIVTNYNQYYDLKITFDRISGKMMVYRDDVFLATWTDLSPPTYSGNYVSFRTGNCKAKIKELEVFRSRYPTTNISVGNSISKDIRFQNMNPASFAAKIKSIVNDSIGNISTIASHNLKIDYTQPINISIVNDSLGIDIDTTHQSNQLSANWTPSTDINSDISEYWYSIGTMAGDSDIVAWTNNLLDSFVVKTGLSLINNQKYFINLRMINGAGLSSSIASSDGVVYEDLFIAINLIENLKETVVFPNPSNGSFTIDSKTSINEIQINDLLGNAILKRSGNNQTKLKIENLRNSTYILILTDKNNKTTYHKIICN
ncbi:MAG: T9SS type A sorting domain-containing protein [Bacteroidetes bacterium]|nr:T9SS type A sorting domain-containing protein [Bacteroidota bacterium]